MALKTVILALGMIAAAAPAWAANEGPAGTTAAPEGTAETRYCMRVEAVTGSRLEQVQCWTRDEWADQGVDVDRDWAEEGVRAIG